MISSSEGCRIMSEGKKAHVQGQKSWETADRLTEPLSSPNSGIAQVVRGGAEVHIQGMASYLCTSWHWGYGLAWCPAHLPQRSSEHGFCSQPP